jgi:hypothetical protein
MNHKSRAKRDREIIELRAQGQSLMAIAVKYLLTENRVCQIVMRERLRHPEPRVDVTPPHWLIETQASG